MIITLEQLAQHAMWLADEGDGGERLDLRGANLSEDGVGGPGSILWALTPDEWELIKAGRQ